MLADKIQCSEAAATPRNSQTTPEGKSRMQVHLARAECARLEHKWSTDTSRASPSQHAVETGSVRRLSIGQAWTVQRLPEDSCSRSVWGQTCLGP